MDVSQMIFVRHDTNVTPNTGGTFGSQLDLERGPADPQRGGDGAGRRCSALAATQLGVPASEPDREQGRRLGRRQVRHLRRADRRQAASTSAMAAASVDPGRRAVEAGQPVQARRRSQRVPRVDIPDKVTGQVHVYVAQHPRAGDAARPARPAARPGRVRRRHDAEDRLGRRELDQAHRRASGSSAATNFLGVVAPQEYAAIQAAAQLKVKWADPPTIAGSGNLWKQMRDFDAAGQAPARIAVNAGNVDTALRGRADEGLARATSTSTTATCRSARAAPSAT